MYSRNSGLSRYCVGEEEEIRVYELMEKIIRVYVVIEVEERKKFEFMSSMEKIRIYLVIEVEKRKEFKFM